MSLTRSDGYEKTDFDFTTARSVIRGVYLVFMVLIVLCGLGGFIAAAGGVGRPSVGLMTIFISLIVGLILHVGYSFLVGFFELIKHAREIRNELAALRIKSDASAPAPVTSAQSVASSGTTRYDSATHQYVKA